MAESNPKSNEEQEEGGSWWGSWIQAAKETSASAYEFVRRDLGEFTCTVQSETEHALNATTNTVRETVRAENASTARNRMKEGINTLFQGITKVLTIPPDDEGEKPLMIVSSESAIYDRSKARLHAIQVDPGTYLTEPSGSPEHFKEWCRYFDIESKKGDISELLVSKVEVRALYTKLVPAEIAHASFWQRYFYKLHQMALDEARKQALIKRAESSGRSNSVNDDWGSGDEDDIEIVELKDVPPKSPPVPHVPFPRERLAEKPKSETPKSTPKTEVKTEPKELPSSVESSVEKQPETSKTVQNTTELNQVQKTAEAELNLVQKTKELNQVQKTAEAELNLVQKTTELNQVQKTAEAELNQVQKTTELNQVQKTAEAELNLVQKTTELNQVPVQKTTELNQVPVQKTAELNQVPVQKTTELNPVQKTTELKEQPGSSELFTENKSVPVKPEVDDTPTSKVLPETLPTSAKETKLSPTESKSETQPECPEISVSMENVEKAVLQKTDISNNTNNSANSNPSPSVKITETLLQPSNMVDEENEIENSKTFDSKKDIGTKSDNIEPKPFTPEVVVLDSLDQSNKPEKEMDQSQSSVSRVVESENKDSKMKVEVLPPSGSDIKTKDKDDMVIVGGDRVSPISDSSGNKDTSTEDDWDKDFDLDVTEEELQVAEELAKKIGEDFEEDDDWESWE